MLALRPLVATPYPSVTAPTALSESMTRSSAVMRLFLEPLGAADADWADTAVSSSPPSAAAICFFLPFLDAADNIDVSTRCFLSH
ncbi:hypothetical protein BCR44DRAFT_1428594 [Catenaria anguillulae PL171]|uniref:Uncharacterized protein n=1 Tax=Catenaria anguillulae PL171 TaxID=765915 RepID=A0A1Y2HVI0_9FUNG|nr:hypothetical protein BCR44DRAFT_1428594 [Catenaria anguillulae PL171]